MALRRPASRRHLFSEGRERATRGGKREKVVEPILVDRLQLRLQCPGSDPKASFEDFEYGFPRPFGFSFPRPFGFKFPRPFGFEFVEQRRFDHGFASSQELEQLRVMIPQTGQKLGHGQQVFVLMGRRVLIDAGATLEHDRLGGSIELSQRYPGDQADVGRGQQFLGGDLPQLGDPPGEPPVGSALAAAQVDGAGGLDIPLGVEEQDHGLGEDAAI